MSRSADSMPKQRTQLPPEHLPNTPYAARGNAHIFAAANTPRPPRTA